MLLFDIATQYKGYNNGDFSAAWKLMKPRGWKSRETLGKALKELVHYGLIELTRQGGLHRTSLYATTWWAIDDCRGKLDVSATRVASGLWRKPTAPFDRKRPKGEKLPSTPGVSIKHDRRVNSVPEAPDAVTVSTPGMPKEPHTAVA